MRVLYVHNRYVHAGGEDRCVTQELAALREAGVETAEYLPRNQPDLRTALDAFSAPFKNKHTQEFTARLAEFRPNIVHSHNLFPLLSPRFFGLAKKAGARNVLTLHNYRPLCLNGLFLTPSEEVCERCAAGNYWPGIARGCYRGSRVQSAGMAAHLEMAARRRWYDSVDRFIAPAQFLKEKFVSRGWRADRIDVQGHFISAMPVESPAAAHPYLLYMGRLSNEKGVAWLLKLFQEKAPDGLELKIAGTGPLTDLVRKACGDRISYLGFVEGPQKDSLLRQATALVMPSICYENFPLAVVEANAWGVPALVSNEGGLRELVIPGINGERFAPGSAEEFWAKLERMKSPGRMESLRRATQEHARNRFSKTAFLAQRMALYERVMAGV